MLPETVLLALYESADYPLYSSMVLTCTAWWRVASENLDHILTKVLRHELSWLETSPIFSDYWSTLLDQADVTSLRVLYRNLEGEVEAYQTEVSITKETLRFASLAEGITFDKISKFAQSVSTASPVPFRVLFKEPQVHTPETLRKGTYWTFGGHSLFGSGLNYSQPPDGCTIRNETNDLFTIATTAPVTCCLGYSMNSSVAMRQMSVDFRVLASYFPPDLCISLEPNVEMLTAGLLRDDQLGLWRLIQNDRMLYRSLLASCCEWKAKTEIQGLVDAAIRLIEFCLGVGISQRTVRKERLLQWWEKNLECYNNPLS